MIGVEANISTGVEEAGAEALKCSDRSGSVGRILRLDADRLKQLNDGLNVRYSLPWLVQDWSNLGIVSLTQH